MALIDYEYQISEILKNFDFKKVQDYLAYKMRVDNPDIEPPPIERLKVKAESALREVTKATTFAHESGGWYARRHSVENTLRLDFSIESWDMLEALS